MGHFNYLQQMPLFPEDTDAMKDVPSGHSCTETSEISLGVSVKVPPFDSHFSGVVGLHMTPPQFMLLQVICSFESEHFIISSFSSRSRQQNAFAVLVSHASSQACFTAMASVVSKKGSVVSLNLSKPSVSASIRAISTAIPKTISISVEIAS